MGSPRWTTPSRAAVCCPGRTAGRRRTRVTECFGVLRAEEIYTSTPQGNARAAAPGRRGSAIYKLATAEVAADWEVSERRSTSQERKRREIRREKELGTIALSVRAGSANAYTPRQHRWNRRHSGRPSVRSPRRGYTLNPVINTMTPDQWARVKEVFHAALERGVEERMAFVARVCDARRGAAREKSNGCSRRTRRLAASSSHRPRRAIAHL